MKLLFCPSCFDVIKLDFEPRKCKCGLVAGKYIDDTYAVVNGEGYSLAIGNGSLLNACYNASAPRSERRPKSSEVICWIRPHEGESNPHTKIDPMFKVD
jgi:hypothetical protein